MNTPFEEKVTSHLESITKSIEKLATKDEISKLPTKDDLNEAIDGLAGTVKKGFDEVHEKIGNIQFKIDRMDTRFTNQLDYFHLYYPTRKEFTELDGRMKRVEKRLKVQSS
jgi:hypothetical protein